MSFAVFIVTFTTIAHWFDRKRSRAMTVAVAGFGISGILVPLLALAIGEFGWRETLIIVGIAAWVIGIPLSSLMRHKPRQYGYLPDGDSPETASESKSMTNLPSASDIVKQGPGSSTSNFTVKAALKTRAFWLLSASSFFQFIGASAIMVHIVPYLESVEIPTAIAATVVTGITVCSLIGRLGFGFIGDFANKRNLITIGIILQTIGIFALSFVHMDRVWLIVPFLLTYAPGFGATIPLRLALEADYFGTESLGAIMGVMALVSMVGGLASPIIAGWIFDATGSYQLAWQLFALVSVPAIPLMLLIKPPRVLQ
jgi:sugar phosphate permease